MTYLPPDENNPKTFTELAQKVMAILPHAQLEEDLDGQIVIYTNLKQTSEEDMLEQFSDTCN